MKTISFAVQAWVCDECSLALRRFLAGIDGIESVDVDGRNISALFDQEMINGESVVRIADENPEKRGHKLAHDGEERP